MTGMFIDWPGVTDRLPGISINPPVSAPVLVKENVAGVATPATVAVTA